MGRGVADQFQPGVVLVRDDRQPAVGRDPVAGVEQLVADLAGQGRLGQTRANRCRHFSHRHPARKCALRAVWERDVNHGRRLSFQSVPWLPWGTGGAGKHQGRKRKSAKQALAFRRMGVSCKRGRPSSAAGERLQRSSLCHNRTAFPALFLFQRFDAMARILTPRPLPAPQASARGLSGHPLDAFLTTDCGNERQALAQWNCCSSVEPVSAFTLEGAPWSTVVTSSKYPAPPSCWCDTKL